MLKSSIFKKHQESGLRIRRPIEQYILRGTTIGFTAFLATLFSASILAPVEVTDATSEVLLANQATGGSVSLTTSGNINLSMKTSAVGSQLTVADAVTVQADSAGYQLYLSTVGSSNALTLDGSSETIPAGGGDTISSPSALGTNTWGFAVAQPNATSGSGSEDVVTNGFDSTYPTGTSSSASSKFTKVPVSGSAVKIAQRSGATESAGTLTNVYYGANVSSAKPSGLYTNTITYTAIGDATTAGLASVTPSRTNRLAGGEVLTISTPSTLTLASISSINVTVGGGTCTNATAIKNGSLTNVTCIAPSLATGWHEVVVNINTTANTTETYVVNPGIEYYLEEGGSQVATYMQDFTVLDCSNMTVGNSIALQDKRDSNVYQVTKQADGNCWMTENLRLGTTSDGASTQGITLTSTDSDMPAGSNPYTINSADIQTSGTDDWSTNVDATHVYSFAGTDNAKTYGNLYNWYTATASSGTASMTNIDASSSICPKGWQLPPNTGVGSYTELMKVAVNSSIGSGTNTTYTNAFQATPLSFVFSGYYVSELSRQGSYGNYWSRTAYSSSTYAYVFYFDSSGNYDLQSGGRKYLGRAVRCVFMNTMQNFSSLACTNLQTAQSITLKDSRDQNEYSVTKQADGNCWMTDNLQLGTTVTKDSSGTPTSASIASSDITLTSADSDVTTNFTIPVSQIQSSGNSAWYNDTDDASITSSLQTVHVFSLPANNLSYASAGVDGKSYGNLYNWYTATAGTGLRSTGSTTTEDAPSSICPKGWKLPPNTGVGSYTELMKATISSNIPTSGNASDANKTAYTDKFQATPLFFVLSGFYNNGSTALGSRSYYWSRTANSVDNARSFNFNINGYFGLIDGYYKYNGFAMRCVFLP